MRKHAWIRVLNRVAVVLLLAVAGFVSLAHQAQHPGGDGDCPVCLQGHAGPPALVRQVLPLTPPTETVRTHPAPVPTTEHGPEHTCRACRAPPLSIA